AVARMLPRVSRQHRQLFAARAAPGRPEREDDRLAAEGVQGDVLAVQRVQRDVRRGLAHAEPVCESGWRHAAGAQQAYEGEAAQEWQGEHGTATAACLGRPCRSSAETAGIPADGCTRAAARRRRTAGSCPGW